eukprot:SAG11_NODE_689_length_7713_cov_3.470055_10_plen_140_part_00
MARSLFCETLLNLVLGPIRSHKSSLFSEGILSVEKGGGREVLVIVKFRGFIHRFEFTRYRGTAVLSSTKITRNSSFSAPTYLYSPYKHDEIMPRRSTIVLPIRPADADLIHCGYFGVKSAPVGLPPNLIAPLSLATASY